MKKTNIVSLKNIDGEEIQHSALVAPPIDDLNLDEKEKVLTKIYFIILY